MICELHLSKLLMGGSIKKKKIERSACGQMLMTEEVGCSWGKYPSNSPKQILQHMGIGFLHPDSGCPK